MKSSRGRLTRSLIAQEALALLDEAGMKGLSMRKLGSRLGVEAMSLYNHVKNKSDLLDSIHEALLVELMNHLDAAPPADWGTAARTSACTFLALLKRHPGSIPLFASRSAIAPGSLKFLNRSLETLTGAGLPPAEGLLAFQTIFCFTVGHAQFHYGPRSSDSYARVEDYAKFEHLDGLRPDRDPDDEFQFGLEAILAGLAVKMGAL